MPLTNLLRKPATRHFALIFLVVAATFGNTLLFGFVWDDTIFLVGNDVYRRFDLGGMLLSLANDVEYLPVRDISYAVDYLVWGENPLGFHLTNVLLYFLNAVFIYLVTVRTTRLIFARVNRRLVRRSREVSLVTTLLFAVHPIHSEVVSFITCRNVLLSGLFFFMSCYFYLKYLRPHRGKRALFLFAALVCCVLSLLSKATSITLPGVLLLLTCLGSGSLTRRFVALVPFFLVSFGAYVFFREVAMHTGAADPDQVVVFGASSLSSRMAVAAQIPFFYLQKLFLPIGLSAEYTVSFPALFGHYQVILATLGLFLVSILALAVVRSRPWLCFGLAWFLVAMVPVLNFLATTPVVADRYVYLPSYAFSYVVAAVLCSLSTRARAGGVWGTAIVIVVALGITAYRRNQIWESDKTLWQDTIEVSPRASKAYHNLGSYYLGQGEFARALEVVRKLEEYHGAKHTVDYFRALHAFKTERYSRVIELLQNTKTFAGSIKSLCLLGKAYEKTGDDQKAIESYLEALKCEGVDQDGDLKQARMRLVELRARFRSELESLWARTREEPSDLNAKVQLAISLDRIGLYDEALQLYSEVTSRGVKQWSLYYNIGNVYKKTKRFREAIPAYQASLALNPENPDAHNNLAICFRRIHEYARAIESFKAAIAADPRFAMAPFNLAALYFRLGDRENALRYFNLVVQSFPQLRGRAHPYLEQLR